MPANYAHYRFGIQAVPQLSADAQRLIRRFRQLYDVGLHGPDLFFYYNPLMRTSVGALGSKFHSQSGTVFFTRICKKLQPSPPEAALAYLYGLLGHYCLDSVCHPFVNATVAGGQIGHTELETEFDRFLLETDGRIPPETQNLSGHMKLTRGECVTVAEFYTPATPANINRCVHIMSLSTRLLAGKNRKLLKTVLSAANETVAQSLMPGEPNANCAHLDGELLRLYDLALERYPILLEELTAHLHGGEPLGADFEPSFG